ncbi:hypothetical protein Dimus_013235, partial [Dionaea muscipula]
MGQIVHMHMLEADEFPFRALLHCSCTSLGKFVGFLLILYFKSEDCLCSCLSCFIVISTSLGKFTGFSLFLYFFWCNLKVLSVMFARLANDGTDFEEMREHVNDYADAGLRTLILAYCKLDEEEYRDFNEKFFEAINS